ncbi:glycosyl transferase [Micromonospora sonchi]|uniref:Glycosyl transferase n=1 Tax=Micromonospora sonchi TaxID=1763543 RepID=A0A917TRK7_9ACTN|nr:glycosyl transferase [Micromonospora sonchi]
MAVPVVDPSLNPVSETVEAQPPTRRPRRWPARSDVLAIGAYVLLGVLVCLNYWVDVNNRVSSHLPTDHSWFEWLFSHGAYSVLHLENPLFSMRQNAPDGVNMMANTSLLGVTLPLAPLTWLLGPQVVYALYLGGAMAATAGTSYWMLSRHLVRSRAAAFVGGAFLGFAPGIVHHANGQPNFVSNFLLPLIVVRVFRLTEPGRWRRNGLVLGLLVAYQIFINEEMLLLTALACLVVVIAYAIMRPRAAWQRAGTFGAGLGVGGGLALLLAAYPIWYQFNGPQSYRGLQGGVFHSWGEDLAAFVAFPRDTIAGDEAVEATIGLTEQNTWFGWPLMLLSVVALALLVRRSLIARILAVLTVVFSVASLGPEIRFNGELTGTAGPWSYIPADLPLVEMMMPTRLTLVTTAALGVLLALAWDAVAGNRRSPIPAPRAGEPAADAAPRAGKPVATVGHRPRWQRGIGYAAITLAVLPLLPTPLPAEPVDPPPAFITTGAWRAYVPDGRALVPVPIPSNVHGLSTLRWSALTQHEFPIPAGYFIGPNQDGAGVFGAPNRPTSTLIYRTMDAGELPDLTDEDRRQAVEDLRFWRASVVVLGAHPKEAVLRDLMTALLGEPQRVDDVWLWNVRDRA